MAADGADASGGVAPGGAAAPSPAPVRLALPVAVTVADERNTLAVPLQAVASVPVEDVRFEFDSSFLLPDASRALERVAPLHARFPSSRITLFGHADRTGDADYNKKLSGRRARSVYATLLRDTAIWEDLYQNPLGRDDWRGRPVQAMLQMLGFDPGPIDGIIGNKTTNALKQFQTTAGLPATGKVNPTTRRELFGRYMDAICLGTDGQPFKLAKEQFLGRGQDADGKADYQGCSEFNPIMVPSKSQVQTGAAPGHQNQRDFINAANRRVTLFFLAPGVEIKPDEWPCPRAGEGPADCRKRFWSDGDARLSPGAQPRRQRDSHDTYACRFYERITLTADPNEDGTIRPGQVRARWSKPEVLPVHNSGFPPATPPTDAIPDDAKVELVADTQGVPDGTPAHIEIKRADTDAVVPGVTLEDLEVRGDQVVVTATGARPVFSFDATHQPWEVWDKPFFYLSVRVDDDLGSHGESPHDPATDDDRLRVRPVFVTIADAIADTPAGGGLSTVDEMNEIGNIHKLDPARGVYLIPFNQAVVATALWGSVIRNSYCYHQTSHGDVRCRVDGDQFASHADAPTVCPNDPSHPGRSVLFIGDTPIGDAETSDVAAVPSVPRYLVYINTCVAGFEPSFANALMARGTRNVIAFRKYIPDDDAREMARQFYRKWTEIYRGDPERIPEVFLSVAPVYTGSMRPILFGPGGGDVAAADTAVGQALGALA